MDGKLTRLWSSQSSAHLISASSTWRMLESEGNPTFCDCDEKGWAKNGSEHPPPTKGEYEIVPEVALLVTSARGRRRVKQWPWRPPRARAARGPAEEAALRRRVAEKAMVAVVALLTPGWRASTVIAQRRGNF